VKFRIPLVLLALVVLPAVAFAVGSSRPRVVTPARPNTVDVLIATYERDHPGYTCTADGTGTGALCIGVDGSQHQLYVQILGATSPPP
jgi:hypothetical protein